MSENNVKLCKDCKFYRPRNYEQIMHTWVLAGSRCPKIRYEDMCGHDKFLSLVDGSPQYSCHTMRKFAEPCSKNAIYFEKKEEKENESN